MREKMKKMLFLMLFLLILGAANVNSQVRIGGNGVPNGAAVLDLNSTDATINGTKGLALPRVSLASTTDQLGYATLLNGMLVYNTNASSGAGVYYWATNQWVKVSDGSFTEVDGVIGNEITDTIAGGGLTRSGSGTAVSPYKVGIKTNGIVNSMIADRAVSLPKINTTASDSGLLLMSNGTGVVAFGGFQSYYNDTVKLIATPTKSVTWQLVLDTTFNITVPQGHIGRISASGIKENDRCYEKRGHMLFVFFPQNNFIRATSMEKRGTLETAVQLFCVRPIY
ncbi:hypothetical protein FACS189451_13000 [Bacteroidia bacterium]|nr:hypothetical protein FACS189451_13000 [Bacteroidia bacterium]